jgi:hypothetical protein
MKATVLSETQITILKAAAGRTDGNIEPLPAQLKGGARLKVIQGLLGRTLIEQHTDAQCSIYRLTDDGYAAIGQVRPMRTISAPRTSSKQALLIGLLQRPEGMTITQAIDATGWQAHTIRGALAGVLKKRLGLNITSAKGDDNIRIYRIAC